MPLVRSMGDAVSDTGSRAARRELVGAADARLARAAGRADGRGVVVAGDLRQEGGLIPTAACGGNLRMSGSAAGTTELLNTFTVCPSVMVRAWSQGGGGAAACRASDLLRAALPWPMP